METDVLKKLNDLFEFSSPQSLRKSIHEVFFNYLLHNHQNLPVNFNTITSDFYFLIQFLQEAEEQMASAVVKELE